MDLNDCYKNNLIKRTKIDKELIKSLMEMSNIKEDTVKSAKINDKNISAYFSMSYESLREILEAVCISFGYKVTSHLCLGELLKKLIPGFDFSEFDRLRYARNGVNYYGTKIEFQQGNELIKKTFRIKKEFLLNFKSNLDE
jgi:hypothetical protein